MTPEQIERAARALVAARKGQPIAGAARRRAAAIGGRFLRDPGRGDRQLGEQIGGWKVGFSPRGRHLLRADLCLDGACQPGEPAGRGLHVHRHRVRDRLSGQPGAVGRGRSPTAATRCWRPSSLHPTIEVVDSRYQDFRSLDRLQVLADNFSNGGLVYGAAASGWQGIDLVHPPIEVTADGKPFADCTGLRAGDPIGLLRRAGQPCRQPARRRAGRHLRHHRHSYRPGLHRAGDADRADYGPLGRVEVSFPR